MMARRTCRATFQCWRDRRGMAEIPDVPGVYAGRAHSVRRAHAIKVAHRAQIENANRVEIVEGTDW